MQGGSSAGWYDYLGSQFTGSKSRFQNFVTTGVYQRLFDDRLAYGLAHDWLADRYYDTFHLSQWRLKVSWQKTPCDEIGIWATVADKGQTVLLAGVPNHFRAFSQGVGYWQRQWHHNITTQVYWGVAAEPGEFVFGGNSQVPLNDYWGMTSSIHYVLPSASAGAPGFAEATWNASAGVQFYIGGGAMATLQNYFRPLFNMADNGSFAVRRT